MQEAGADRADGAAVVDSSTEREKIQQQGGRPSGRLSKPWIKAQFDEASSACKHCSAIVGLATSSRKRVSTNGVLGDLNDETGACIHIC